MGPENERGPGNELGEGQRSEQIPHLGNYTLTPVSKALRYGPCVTRESQHSFTCHPHMNQIAAPSDSLLFVRPINFHLHYVPAFTPQPQGVTALWLVFIAPTYVEIARVI